MQSKLLSCIFYWFMTTSILKIYKQVRFADIIFPIGRQMFLTVLPWIIYFHYLFFIWKEFLLPFCLGGSAESYSNTCSIMTPLFSWLGKMRKWALNLMALLLKKPIPRCNKCVVCKICHFYSQQRSNLPQFTRLELWDIGIGWTGINL